MALKVVKSAQHYTETALDEIKLLKCVSLRAEYIHHFNLNFKNKDIFWKSFSSGARQRPLRHQTREDSTAHRWLQNLWCQWCSYPLLPVTWSSWCCISVGCRSHIWSLLFHLKSTKNQYWLDLLLSTCSCSYCAWFMIQNLFVFIIFSHNIIILSLSTFKPVLLYILQIWIWISFFLGPYKINYIPPPHKFHVIFSTILCFLFKCSVLMG